MSWIVNDTTDKIQVVTTAVGSIRLHASFVDNNAGVIAPDMTNSGAIVTATTTDLFAASAASHQRRVKAFVVFNDHASVAQNITIQLTDGTNVSPLWKGNLLAGEFVIGDSNGNFTQYDSGGHPLLGGPTSLFNMSVAAQSPFASDTYLAGSNILCPVTGFKAKTFYEMTFDVTKTAAGVAAPTVIVRIGTAGTTADAARLTFTFPAQTAVADNGRFTCRAGFRTVGGGTAAVLQGRCQLDHNLAVTGLSSVNPVGYCLLLVTSGGFDSTPASQIIGVSVNGGASAAWTVQLVEASLVGL